MRFMTRTNLLMVGATVAVATAAAMEGENDLIDAYIFTSKQHFPFLNLPQSPRTTDVLSTMIKKKWKNDWIDEMHLKVIWLCFDDRFSTDASNLGTKQLSTKL